LGIAFFSAGIVVCGGCVLFVRAVLTVCWVVAPRSLFVVEFMVSQVLVDGRAGVETHVMTKGVQLWTAVLDRFCALGSALSFGELVAL
jgi:hypothetical protein